MEDHIVTALIKAGSSVGGAILALIFVPPKTRLEFYRRLAFAALVGFIVGEPLRTEYFHWPDSVENVIGAAAIAAFVSWFVSGALLRLAEMRFKK